MRKSIVPLTRGLEYITRPSCKYRNIYITDGDRKTELDNLILTENGLIILEVKNVKTDITINENGRILYDNQCYYIESDNSIHIWNQYIEHVSAAEATNVILHELYHAYQHSLINSSAINWDSPDIQTNAYFKKIWQWKQESESYIQGDRWDGKFDAYYEQSIESDARDFAETFTPRFIYTEGLDDSL